MNIGEAAQRTGLSAKTIRYYESVNLIESTRDQNGYRQFTDEEVSQLLFIKQLRGLGFKLSDCNALIDALAKCAQTDGAGRHDVELALLLQTKLEDVNGKLTELASLRESIAQSISDVQQQTTGSEFIRLLNKEDLDEA